MSCADLCRSIGELLRVIRIQPWCEFFLSDRVEETKIKIFLLILFSNRIWNFVEFSLSRNVKKKSSEFGFAEKNLEIRLNEAKTSRRFATTLRTAEKRISRWKRFSSFDESKRFVRFSAVKNSYATRINPTGIFANNELDLQQINVYGFDFGSFRKSKKNSFLFVKSVFVQITRWRGTNRVCIRWFTITRKITWLKIFVSVRIEKIERKTKEKRSINFSSVSRWNRRILLSAEHGRSRNSFRHKTWLVDESR